MKKILAAASLVIVLVAGPPCVRAESDEAERLVICYRDSADSGLPGSPEMLDLIRRKEAALQLPLAVAKKQGLFAKHGVDVQLKAVSAMARSPLEDCDVLFIVNFLGLTLPQAKPEQIRFMFPVAITGDENTVKALVVKKRAEIKDWEDFKGKSLAVLSFEDEAVFWKFVLPKVGLQARDVKLKPLIGSLTVASFPANPELHAIYCDKATMRKLMREAPDKLEVFASNLESRFVGNPYYVTCAALNWPRCREKQDALGALAHALDEAIDQIRDDPDRSVGSASELFEGLDEKAATDLGVHSFTKSSEPCDFKALNSQFRKDLESYYWRSDRAERAPSNLESTEGEVQPVTLHGGSASSLDISRDGKLLVTQNATIWNIPTREVQHALNLGRRVARISPDGETIAVGNGTTVVLCSVDDREKLATFEGHAQTVSGLSFSPDGRRLASASAPMSNTDESGGEVRLWDVEAKTDLGVIASAPPRSSRTRYGFTSVKYAPNGEIIAMATGNSRYSGGTSGEIWIYDLTEQRVRLRFSGHQRGGMYAIAFAPDSKTLATAGGDKTVKLWDVSSGHNTATFDGHTDWVVDVAYSPDGKTVASACYDESAKIWDVSTSKCRRTLYGHANKVIAVTFSHDGEILATSSYDGTIKLWPSTVFMTAAAPRTTTPVLALRAMGVGVNRLDRGDRFQVEPEEDNFTSDGRIKNDVLLQIRQLPRVKLWLAQTPITDAGLEDLKELTNLVAIDVQQTRITDDGLEHLKGLKDLESLGLFMNRKITDKGLKHVRNLVNLQSLDLAGANITDSGIMHLKELKRLRSLNLYGAQATDQGLMHLKDLRELRSLNLNGATHVTDQGVTRLQQEVPECKIRWAEVR